MSASPGRLVILSGPSCVGKTPLSKALKRFYPDLAAKLRPLVLYNSRVPRPGEQSGVDYHFRTREQVEALRGEARYVVLDVRGDLQALDLDDLSAVLQRGDALFEGNPFVGRLLQTHAALGGVARARATDARIAFQVGDAQALAVADDTFDAVVSGLVLNFVSEPAKMVAEMVRAGRPGSAIALYVWDYAAGMELMRCFWNAAKALEPEAAALDEAVLFPGCAPAPLEALFTATGLSGVATRAIDVRTRFRDFDDYWSPFLGGQGPAPAYAMSLPEGRRVALREAIRASLPIASDGSIPLAARAWAVRGSKADITAPR